MELLIGNLDFRCCDTDLRSRKYRVALIFLITDKETTAGCKAPDTNSY